MSEEKKPAPFPLRMPPELKKALEAMAESDGRSLNAYLIRVLTQHVAKGKKS